jgi:two-component system nitrate/nitrite sensor histidine kinase NarQ
VKTGYIKLFILFIPSFAIGFWEYARHKYFMYELTMEQGNWLAPLIVLAVTAVFVTPLFRRLEKIQVELHRVSKSKVQLEEREKLAQELHDGIAQSLFLLSVKLDKLERQSGQTNSTNEIRSTVHEINQYVRESIASLKAESIDKESQFDELISGIVEQFSLQTGTPVSCVGEIHMATLQPIEKSLLSMVVREGLFNIQKHTNATTVRVEFEDKVVSYQLRIADNGTLGLQPIDDKQQKFGLSFLRNRSEALGWELSLKHSNGWTCLQIEKRK